MDFEIKVRGPNTIFPLEISKEVNLIDNLIEKSFLKYSENLNLEAIVNKLRANATLTLREIRALLYNQEQLNTDILLFESFGLCIARAITKDNFNLVFGIVISKFAPWGAVKMLTRCKEITVAHLDVPIVLKNALPYLHTFKDRDAFVSKIIEDFHTIADIFKNLAFVQDDSPIFTSVISGLSSYNLFIHDTHNYLQYLFKFKGVSSFNVIEAHLSRYILENPRWSTYWKNKENFLSHLLLELEQYKFIHEQYGPLLKDIFNSSRMISEAFKLLGEKSLDRAKFWEALAVKFLQIIPKHFDKGKRIGLALYLPSYVIVEFAPSGNAAYIYKRDIFESSILQGDEWKNIGVAGDSSYNASFFRPYEQSIVRGTFIHIGAWQGNLMKIIERLERV